MNDFDRIAPYYDRLSKLVFGKQLLNASCYHLNRIHSNHKVLLLGGGTGEILPYFPQCQRIDFLEKSGKMIERASARDTANEIHFIHADFLSHDGSEGYDAIVCPFFLDCFNEHNLVQVLAKIRKQMVPEGMLLVSDFAPSTSPLLRVFMHAFFRISAQLESRELKDIHQFILSEGLVEDEKNLYQNTLFSRLYRNLY